MNPFNDHKTAQDRLLQAGTNDWYIIPVVILAGVISGIAVYGADDFIEDVGSLIYKIVY